MNKKSLIKLFSAIYVLALALWLGGSIIRMSIAYDIYVPATELQFKSNYSDEIRLHNVKLYGMGALYTDIAYGFAFFSAIMLMFLMKGRLKLKGWPVISFTLFFISVPIEAMMIYYDIKLNLAIHYGNLTSFDSEIIKEFFISKFTKYNYMSPSAYLCGASSMIFSILRPLDREGKN